jgi:hypothetical protein
MLFLIDLKARILREAKNPTTSSDGEKCAARSLQACIRENFLRPCRKVAKKEDADPSGVARTPSRIVLTIGPSSRPLSVIRAELRSLSIN